MWYATRVFFGVGAQIGLADLGFGNRLIMAGLRPVPEHCLAKSPKLFDYHHLGLVGVSTPCDFRFEVLHNLPKLEVQRWVGAKLSQEFEIVR